MPDQFLGVALDPRTEVQKAQDHSSEEFAMAAPINWIDKPMSTWRSFKKRDQNGSGMCMAQSGVKILGIENYIEEGEFVVLSALPVYQARYNKTTPGMWQQDLFEILSKPIACKEEDVPSQFLTEDEANWPKVVLNKKQRSDAEFYRSNGYQFLPIDIDKIAGAIDQGKGVQLIIFFLGSEYWKPTPGIIDPSLTVGEARTLRHGIAAVDYTLWNGEKALVIEDSAGTATGFNGSHQRIITESFLKKRCYGAGYLIYKKNMAEVTPKPKHTFTVPLVFGMMNNPEVAELQKVLQYEGFLPFQIDNNPLPLGNFLQMTATALKKWQVKHNILDFANEPDVRKVRFGSKSIAEANKLYA